MGKYTLSIAILFVVLFLSLFTVFYYEIFFSVKQEVFFTQWEETFKVNRFYGLDDEDFESFVNTKELVNYEKENMVLAAYFMDGYVVPSSMFLVLLDNETNEKKILLNQRYGYKYYNYEQYLIDLDVFNKILGLEGETSHNNIIDKYLKYIHYDPYREKGFSKILNKDMTKYENYSIYEIKVWHQPRGIVNYFFTIRENQLIEVRSEFFGKRGDEIVDVYHDHRGKIDQN